MVKKCYIAVFIVTCALGVAQWFLKLYKHTHVFRAFVEPYFWPL